MHPKLIKWLRGDENRFVVFSMQNDALHLKMQNATHVYEGGVMFFALDHPDIDHLGIVIDEGIKELDRLSQ